jgi:hypothetical protein
MTATVNIISGVSWLYEGRLIHLITPSRNFVEVWWRPVALAFLTTLHPLLENVLQTVHHFETSCLGVPFSWLEKTRNRMGRDLDSIGLMDELLGFWSTFSKPDTEFNRATQLLHPKKASFKTTITHTLTTVRGMKITPPLQLGITVIASICITAAHFRQSTNLPNGPRNTVRM